MVDAAPAPEVPASLDRVARVGAGLLLLLGAGIIGVGALRLAFDTEWGTRLIVLGTVVAILAIFTQLVSAAARLMFVVLGGALAFSLYAFELYLSLKPTDIERGQALIAARRAHPDFRDHRTTKQLLEAYAERGVTAWPMLCPTFALPVHDGQSVLPLASVSTSTTVWCNESGQWIVVQTDAHGFVNPQGASDDADVVLVGDSFAQGVCVPPADNLAGQLRATGHSVMSLGCSGNGPLSALGSLVEYAVPLRPKVVLWLFFENNDLSDLDRELGNDVLRSYLTAGRTQNLRTRQAAVDRYWKAFMDQRGFAESDEQERTSRAYRDFITLYRLRTLLGFRRHKPTKMLPFLKRVLARAQAEVTASNGQLVFVYLPAYERYAAQGVPWRDEVLATVRTLGLPIIDFHRRLSDHPDPKQLFPLQLSGHYTSAGYQLLAAQIQDFLGAGMLPERRSKE